MLQVVAAVQPVLLAGVLVPAAVTKLFGRHAADDVRGTALASMLGTARALPAYRLVGGLELIIGILLLIPPMRVAGAVGGTGLAAAFLCYLWYTRRVAPDSSCGCLRGKRSAPVSWRSFARAGLMFVAGLSGVAGADDWPDAVLTHPLAATAVLTIEAVSVVLLSPELDGIGRTLRDLRSRLPRPIFGGSGVAVHASVRQLRRSPVYQRAAGLLHSEMQASWDDKEWRILCYSARYRGRPVTAAFAVPLRRDDPATVRLALVDEYAGTTLLMDPEVPDEDPRAPGRS